MAVTEHAVATAPAAANWLRDLRADWQRRLDATPPPTGQEEEWRRTSLDSLPWDAPVVDVPAKATFNLPDHLADAGVVFGDLATVVAERPELVQRSLGKRQTIDSHAH